MKHTTIRAALVAVAPCAFFLAAACAAPAPADEGLNPFAGRQERANVFAFAAKPKVEKRGGGYTISFATTAACDATVAIVDKDGNVVRHLASGVLGKNAPWPFQQGALTQSIPWDGKDDAGKPAPAGCLVKVGLGLDPRLDRFLVWDRSAVPIKEIDGLAVGPAGEVYVLSGGREASGLPVSSPHVLVFDRDGQYVRTLLPANASVPAERATVTEWTNTVAGKSVPVRRMSFIMNAITRQREWANAAPQAPVITPDGKFVFLVSTSQKESSLVMVDIRDGATPPGSIVTVEKGTDALFDGPVHMTASPDGQWIYIVAACSSRNVGNRQKRSEPGHCVFRVSAKSPGPVARFAGEIGKAGSDDAHLARPSGVACDKAGNVYVADSDNARIQVFKPDGSLLKSIPVKGPRQVAVHPETGAIYVVENDGRVTRLLKLGGLADPSVKATLPVKAEFGVAGLALDASASPPVVWCGYNPWRQYGHVLRLEDRGETFVETPTPLARKQATEGWSLWSHAVLMVGNRQRDELLVNYGDLYARMNGKTGEIIDKLPTVFHGHTQIAPGPDGRYWAQVKPLTTNVMTVYCYDPAEKKFVSLAGGRPAQLEKGKDPVNCVVSWHNAIGRNFPDAMGVAPNGDLYIPFGMRPEHEGELRKAGFEPPPNKGEWTMYRYGTPNAGLLYVYGPDGTLKSMNALPGLGLANGIRVGRHGEVYMVLACQPVGQKAPEGLAPGVLWDPMIWGTLVKFDSRYDKFPVGSIAGRWGASKPDQPTHLYARTSGNGYGAASTRINNLLWDYAGVSPQPMGGGSAGCTCWRSQFDLDGFERVFVPASQTCTVNILDANGNLILRLGGYGNADSMGRESPVRDPKTGAFRPRRPDDPKDLKSPLAEPEIAFLEPATIAVTPAALYVLDRGNERIVRVGLAYGAEETTGLP
jgi:hypothetical protein